MSEDIKKVFIVRRHLLLITGDKVSVVVSVMQDKKAAEEECHGFIRETQDILHSQVVKPTGGNVAQAMGLSVSNVFSGIGIQKIAYDIVEFGVTGLIKEVKGRVVLPS